MKVQLAWKLMMGSGWPCTSAQLCGSELRASVDADSDAARARKPNAASHNRDIVPRRWTPSER